MPSRRSSSDEEYDDDPLLESGRFSDTNVCEMRHKPTNNYPMWLTWLNLAFFIMSFLCLLGSIAFWKLSGVDEVPLNKPDIIYC
jgi:hypothetical protein